MTRIKRGFVAKKRRKKILNLAKGFRGSHSKLFKSANQQVMKSLRYSYFDRRKNKLALKKIWIIRINGSVRHFNLTYSMLVHLLRTSAILLDRKIIAKLCVNDLQSFFKLLTFIK
jgi:large subunit ribosomal protein L20